MRPRDASAPSDAYFVRFHALATPPPSLLEENSRAGERHSNIVYPPYSYEGEEKEEEE
jgi:hypothetical protein